MEKVLVINGCSHSVGSEIPGLGISDGRECRDNSFGALLANKLDRKPIHLAVPGGTNDRILRTTITWLGDNLEKIKANEIDPMFLIHWTGCQRSEYRIHGDPFPFPYVDFDLDNEYKVYSVGIPNNSFGVQKIICDLMIKLLSHDQVYWSDRKLGMIISLQGILKSLGLKYWFGESFDVYSKGKSFQTMSSLVDLTYFPYFDQEPMAFYWYCKNAGFENIDPTGRIWHHGADAHKFYSEFLLNEIQKAGLSK